MTTDPEVRIVTFTPDLYPEAAVHRAREAFHGRVAVEFTVPEAPSDAGAYAGAYTVVLRACRGAPGGVADEFLDAALRYALDHHLGRRFDEPRLPRGL